MADKDKKETIIDLYNDWKSTFDKARTDRPGSLSGAQERFFLNFLEYLEETLAKEHGEIARLLSASSEVQHGRVRRRRSHGRVVERGDDQSEIPFPTDEDRHGA